MSLSIGPLFFMQFIDLMIFFNFMFCVHTLTPKSKMNHAFNFNCFENDNNTDFQSKFHIFDRKKLLLSEFGSVVIEVESTAWFTLVFDVSTPINNNHSIAIICKHVKRRNHIYIYEHVTDKTNQKKKHE